MTFAERGLRRFGPFAVGVLEIVAFVTVSSWIGFGWALLLLLGTSVAGLVLLRFEGFRAWATLRRAAAAGQLASDDEDSAGPGAAARIADTGVRILSGVLLTLPGFVTDVVALLLMVPPVRRSMGRRLSAAVFRTFPTARKPGARKQQPGVQHRPVVIEGEVVDKDHPGH